MRKLLGVLALLIIGFGIALIAEANTEKRVTKAALVHTVTSSEVDGIQALAVIPVASPLEIGSRFYVEKPKPYYVKTKWMNGYSIKSQAARACLTSYRYPLRG